MYQISNFTDNDDVKILAEMGAFQVIEYQRDLSVSPSSAITAYFSSEMNVRKRQLVCYLDKSHVYTGVKNNIKRALEVAPPQG